MVNNITVDLSENLKTCQHYLQNLTVLEINRDNILEWFKGLCKYLTKILTLVGHVNKDNKDNSQKSTQTTLLLYLTQLMTSLSFLINVFVKEEDIKHRLKHSRKCVIQQINCCLEGIENTLKFGNTIIDPSGNFVKWMDACLEKVLEINIQGDPSETYNNCEEMQKLFEEVLSHAMSIAQISLVEDSHAIRGNCQAVLSSLNSLINEISNTKPNSAMVNLFIDACSNKLCKLERKVNTAVLRLCLKAFSEFTAPLKKVHDFCFNVENKGKENELDSLIADFDLHVDRIMQIGLFAVSCSSDSNRGIKIRSCLASLEGLDCELVPALTAVLLEPSVENINNATILEKHWLNQATTLQQLIYLIIDPSAFAQIIYEEATEIIDNLSSIVTKEKLFLTPYDLDELVKTVEVLKVFIENAQKEFTETELCKVKNQLRNLNNILEEIRCASKLFLDKNKVNRDNCFRVLKRCKILLTVLKRLWYCFVNDDQQGDRKNEKLSDDLFLKTENLKVSTGNVFLDHIIKRGKQILEERSILYRSLLKPDACYTTEKQKTNSKSSVSKFTHLRKISFINCTTKADDISMDLQITEILGEMTNLSIN